MRLFFFFWGGGRGEIVKTSCMITVTLGLTLNIKRYRLFRKKGRVIRGFMISPLLQQ